MSENIEHALEHMVAGLFFCMAIAMLLWLHGTFLQQVRVVGRYSERLVMLEQCEERKWNHLDVP